MKKRPQSTEERSRESTTAAAVEARQGVGEISNPTAKGGGVDNSLMLVAGLYSNSPPALLTLALPSCLHVFLLRAGI